VSVLIRVITLRGISNSTDKVDGMWLMWYDADAFDGRGDAHFTIHKDKALRFADLTSAFEAWKTQSKTRPFREDGEPNRPLTAFSVMFDKVE
jgi:hypothetical protein